MKLSNEIIFEQAAESGQYEKVKEMLPFVIFDEHILFRTYSNGHINTSILIYNFMVENMMHVRPVLVRRMEKQKEIQKKKNIKILEELF